MGKQIKNNGLKCIRVLVSPMLFDIVQEESIKDSRKLSQMVRLILEREFQQQIKDREND